jgi:hypothetical protein
MSAQTNQAGAHTPGSMANETMFFSVWREAKVLSRRKLAEFRNEVDALAFAEYRARIEGANDADIDTTVWVLCSDGTVRLHQTYRARAAIAAATGGAA